MHRFWAFPLILGGVAAVFTAFTAAQGWMAFFFSEGKTTPSEAWQMWVLQMGGSLEFSVPWLVALGVVMGLVAATVEMARFGRSDRSGIPAARRLFGNVLWLGSYALIVNASLALALVELTRAGYSGLPGSGSYLPGFFTLIFLFVNAVAVLWAVIRTAATGDVLSPRTLLAKSKASVRTIS